MSLAEGTFYMFTDRSSWISSAMSATGLPRRSCTVLFLGAAQVIELSEEWPNQLLKIVEGAIVEVLHDAFDRPAPGPKSRQTDGLQRVRFVGRLGRPKGTSDLISGFERVAGACPEARLICAGEGQSYKSNNSQTTSGSRIACSAQAGCRLKIRVGS